MSSALSPVLLKRLTLLKFQKPSYVDINEREEFIDLVSYLLDKYILEEYCTQDVISKKDSLLLVSDQWEQSFQNLLKKLHYEHSGDTFGTLDQKIRVLDWLIKLSLKTYYKQNADQIHETKYKCLQRMKLQKIEYSQDELKEATIKLAKLFNIPIGDDPTQMLNAIVRIAERKFVDLPILKPSNNNNTTKTTSTTTTTTSTTNNNSVNELNILKGDSINEEVYPLGFDLSNDKMNTIATILRLLYVSDLREVQNKINQVLALVQNYTSDPQTNFKLGAVGR